MLQKKLISDDLIKNKRSSWLDSSGQVFVLNGSIYRGLKEEGVNIFSYISENGIMPALFKKGLIYTEEAAICTKEFSTVLKHKTIEHVSFPQEWTLKTLKEAALLTCELTLELLESGLMLKDGHPWNLTIDHSKLTFIDFGSISFFEAKHTHSWLTDFYKHFYVPLWIGSKLGSRLAYRCKDEHSTGFSKQLFSSRLISSILLPLAKKKISNVKEFKKIVKKIAVKIRNIRIPNRKGEWSDYQASSWKRGVVKDFIDTVDVKSCIDLACNRGEYSIELATRDIPVVAIDIDEYSVNHLYLFSKSNNLPITPLFLDFLNPTSAFGVGLFYENSYERLKSDASFALAIIHHLVFKSHINFEVFRDIIDSYTKRYALVEFIPKTDTYVQNWLNNKRLEDYSWYTRENFIATFSTRFEIVENWKCPDNNREIFLFKRTS